MVGEKFTLNKEALLLMGTLTLKPHCTCALWKAAVCVGDMSTLHCVRSNLPDGMVESSSTTISGRYRDTLKDLCLMKIAVESS